MHHPSDKNLHGRLARRHGNNRRRRHPGRNIFEAGPPNGRGRMEGVERQCVGVALHADAHGGKPALRGQHQSGDRGARQHGARMARRRRGRNSPRALERRHCGQPAGRIDQHRRIHGRGRLHKGRGKPPVDALQHRRRRRNTRHRADEEHLRRGNRNADLLHDGRTGRLERIRRALRSAGEIRDSHQASRHACRRRDRRGRLRHHHLGQACASRRQRRRFRRRHRPDRHADVRVFTRDGQMSPYVQTSHRQRRLSQGLRRPAIESHSGDQRTARHGNRSPRHLHRSAPGRARPAHDGHPRQRGVHRSVQPELGNRHDHSHRAGRR